MTSPKKSCPIQNLSITLFVVYGKLVIHDFIFNFAADAVHSETGLDFVLTPQISSKNIKEYTREIYYMDISMVFVMYILEYLE